MGVASDIEPRTSMERHLMDRDREGQLYLEARRQQAAVDLLKNRTSFLSTITPPSSNPSSSASSLYHEPSATSSSSLPSSSARQQQQQGAGATTISTTASNNIISLPNMPASPFTNMSPAATTQLQQQAQALAPLGISPSSSSILPTPPHSSATATTTTATTTVLSLAPSLQNSVPIIKKTRQRAATGPGRIRQERDNNNSKGFPDRPVLPISPSSLEYQLTASLLNYTPPSSSNVAAGGTSAAATHTPSSTSTAQSRPRSRSRSKSRPQQQQQHQQHQLPQQLQQAAKTRRHTINKDARIDTTRFSSRGTGHRQQQHPQQQHRHPLHKHNDSDGSNGSNGSNSTSGGNNFNGISVQPMTPQEWTPTSLLGSYPPSPTTATAACALGPTSTSTSDLHHNPYFTSASLALPSHSAPKLLSVPLPPLPPSPPLPPLPPKSPKTLIAQYFPRSLPPPPSRGRPYGQREPIVAPTPFKTPTFGPALISQQQQKTSSTTTHPDAPPLPSPSASFQYIPPADTSLASTSHAVHSPLHQHILNEGGGDNSSSDFSLSNRPSPNASLVGFQGSAVATPKMLPNQQQSARLPSDLDLISHNSRQHHQHQQQQQQQQQQHSRLPPARLACSTSSLHKVTSSDEQDEVLVSPLSVPGPATPILLFAPLRPRSPGPGHSLLGSGIRTTPSTTSLLNPPSPPSPTTLPTTPIYPRGLSSPSILGDNAQVVIRLHQKAVPYIRELVPGKETGPSILTGDNKETLPKAATAGGGGGTSSTVAFVTPAPSEPPSTNTSRDLEMVLDEITGRLRTNRTSMDPWAYNLSPWDDKPLPPVRRERGSRYWVFRDQDGLVMGPILFLLGHIFPPLWWVGALYPRLEHPDDVAALASERARAAEMEAFSASLVAASRAQTHQNQAQRRQEGCEDDDVRDRQNGMALQWLHRQLKTLGVTVASITLSSSSSSSKPQLDNSTSADNSSTIATFQMVQGTPSNREGSTLANVSTIHVPYPPVPTPMPPSILDTRGPWAAASGSSRASSLFEQRMAHDRKLLRYELDLRWRRINLLWSFASFLVAVCTVAIVYAVRK